MSVAVDPAGMIDLDRRVREAVEAVAATDPDPTDPFRGLYITDDVARSLARATSLDVLDGRIATVAAHLGIDGLDADVLLACAAPELSPRYGRLYAYLHDDVTRKLASPRLIARLLSDERHDRDAILARFAQDAPLRRAGALRLLASEQPGPLADRLVKVPDRVAAALLGARLDERGGVRIVAVPEYPLGRDEEIARLRAVGAMNGGAAAVALVVCGTDAAELLAAAAGRPVVLAAPAVAELPDAVLASALEGAVLAVDGGAGAIEPELLRALDAHDRRVVLVGRTRDVAVAAAERAPVVIELELPTFAERESAWRALAGSEDVRDVAAKFRLGMAQIAAAALAAGARAAARGGGEPTADELDACAREASLTRLGELATRIPAAFDWDDLVLPERQRELLHSISAHLRHRDLVLGEWGYDRKVARTQGLKVLFAGDSGTGKTLAAQVLAHALGLDLYRLDLATVVSKYIGETEKNLDRVFAAATGSNAILFFDEADAMLGKRSEVGDAHDRYANLEVAYLLQKMEQHDGCVVLATNLRQNIDEAFIRRLDAVVDFPFPEEDERERLWQLLLPESAPLGDDIDIPRLAREHRLSGGAIRNCSLTAAFLAAEDDSAITMGHLERGVRIEYAKLGRLGA